MEIVNKRIIAEEPEFTGNAHSITLSKA